VQLIAGVLLTRDAKQAHGCGRGTLMPVLPAARRGVVVVCCQTGCDAALPPWQHPNCSWLGCS
jgi:hypothetical protein